MKLSACALPRVSGARAFTRLVPALERLARGLRPARAMIEVSLVGERRMARLNREYKGRGGPAEILTFPYAPERGPGAARGRGAAAARGPIGEIVLCWPAVLRGARERGVPARGYLLRLFAHGAAHLRGYRHDTDAAAARMEAAERRMLAPHVPARELGRLFS